MVAEAAYKRLQDLNSTLASDKNEILDKIFTLPVGAPSRMDLQRRYSNLSYELRALPGKMMVAKSQLKSELTNENDSKTNSLNKVVAEQGSLKLYPYSIKSSPETGTASVVGEVENSGESAVIDVGIEFELFDSNNKSLGTASDFIGRIEPNSRWPFKALILGEEVKDAKFKSLKGLDKLAKEPNN